MSDDRDMLTLAIIGLVSGLITAISPCVLPVLPAILTSAVPTPPRVPVAVGVSVGRASKAASSVPSLTTDAPVPNRLRPVVVVAGLVGSFAIFTLVGGSLLGALRLPEDGLRWAGVIVLALVGIGLLVPAVGEALERPFQSGRLPRLNRGGEDR